MVNFTNAAGPRSHGALGPINHDHIFQAWRRRPRCQLGQVAVKHRLAAFADREATTTFPGSVVAIRHHSFNSPTRTAASRTDPGISLLQPTINFVTQICQVEKHDGLRLGTVPSTRLGSHSDALNLAPFLNSALYNMKKPLRSQSSGSCTAQPCPSSHLHPKSRPHTYPPIPANLPRTLSAPQTSRRNPGFPLLLALRLAWAL